jgi:hypothetical protein
MKEKQREIHIYRRSQDILFQTEIGEGGRGKRVGVK